jgi:glycosyltransferase involved in cell wall biosynthesis
VHSHLFFSSLIARIATPKRIPVINSIHVIQSLDSYSRNKIAIYLEKLTYRKRHHIIAVSDTVLKDFDKWIGLKGSSEVLYNFIRDEFYVERIKSKLNLHPFRMVAVGYLKFQKNYQYVIEAFKHMPPNVTLDIYGGGDTTGYQEQIDKHKLNIRLLGSHNELYKILPEYDAYLMCSLFEGQPLSLLEAIASGLPAILSDIPVLREVTAENAIYFDLNNPKDLANKVERIINGEIDILKHVKPALDRIKLFAKKDIYLRKLDNVYGQRVLS